MIDLSWATSSQWRLVEHGAKKYLAQEGTSLNYNVLDKSGLMDDFARVEPGGLDGARAFVEKYGPLDNLPSEHLRSFWKVGRSYFMVDISRVLDESRAFNTILKLMRSINSPAKFSSLLSEAYDCVSFRDRVSPVLKKLGVEFDNDSEIIVDRVNPHVIMQSLINDVVRRAQPGVCIDSKGGLNPVWIPKTLLDAIYLQIMDGSKDVQTSQPVAALPVKDSVAKVKAPKPQEKKSEQKAKKSERKAKQNIPAGNEVMCARDACQKMFVPARPQQKYCSSDCQHKAKSMRQKDNLESRVAALKARGMTVQEVIDEIGLPSEEARIKAFYKKNN